MVADLKQDKLIDQLHAGVCWQHTAGVQAALLDMSLWPHPESLLRQLSPEEQSAAGTKPAGAEQDHYVRRRVFQRLFVQRLLKLEQSLRDIPLHHARDQRPYCAASPDLCLSFSTAGDMALAAATAEYTIGVDIERFRPVADAVALGDRFFGKHEAQAIRNAPPAQQSAMFIRLWSAKEACLKALGTGVVRGLEKFQFSLQNNGLTLELVPQGGDLAHWSVEELLAPKGYVITLAKRMKP